MGKRIKAFSNLWDDSDNQAAPGTREACVLMCSGGLQNGRWQRGQRTLATWETNDLAPKNMVLLYAFSYFYERSEGASCERRYLEPHFSVLEDFTN